MMVQEEVKEESSGGGGGGEESGGGEDFLSGGLDSTLSETYDKLGGDEAFEEKGGEKPRPGDATPPAAPGQASPTPRSAPKAWASEMHEHWGKLDPKIQDYVELREKQMLDGLGGYKELAGAGKSFQEALAPFLPDIQELRLRPEDFIRNLAGAHRLLSKGSPQEKIRGMQRIALDYGIDLVDVIQGAASAAPAPSDPMVADLASRFNKLEGAITEGQKQQYEAVKTSTESEVSAFAADPTNKYFDEVADDIVLLLQDPRLDLKEAYQRAVWMNPLTRAKEQLRLSEESRVKAAEEAKKARAARGTHVRGSDTDRSPSDSKGSMEDTLRETCKSITSRTS